MNPTPEPGASAPQAFAAPCAPPDVARTGIPFPFLVDLTLKTFFAGGQLKLWEVADRMKLPAAVMEPLLGFMRAERLCEVAHRGPADTDISYQLTDAGRARAESTLARSQYVGPAPVSLHAYVAQVERQSVARMRVSQDTMRRAFDGIVIRDSLLDQIGTALNSSRALLVYGPSGSGKTYIAEHLVNVLYGDIHVPYALYIDGEVILVYDPLVHHPAREAACHEGLDRPRSGDERWVLCRRPVVMTGGELTMSLLDLQFDSNTRFYAAPPQVKANNGLLIIDDLGRQLVQPEQLMNRWIVPLDRRIDHYALHTGKKFSLPFDVNVVFSTNLLPAELADGAFLRRLGYKVCVGPVDDADYRRIFLEVCARTGVPYSEEAYNYLLREHHDAEERPLLACIPLDIVSKLRDRAEYLGRPAEMTKDSLRWAWESYFAAQ